MTANSDWLKKNAVAIVGFALNLILLGIFIGRQTQIIDQLQRRTAALEERMTAHHEDHTIHTNSEWRATVLQKLDRLEGKMDAHILQGRTDE